MKHTEEEKAYWRVHHEWPEPTTKADPKTVRARARPGARRDAENEGSSEPVRDPATEPVNDPGTDQEPDPKAPGEPETEPLRARPHKDNGSRDAKSSDGPRAPVHGMHPRIHSKRLRAPSPEERPPTPSEVIDDLNDRLQQSEERFNVLQDAYMARADQGSTGVAGEAVGGRPSIAALRTETFKRFALQILNLPSQVAKHGLAYVETTKSASLVPDYDVLCLGPPPNRRTTEAREELRRWLTDPAKFRILCGRDPAGEMLRRRMLQDTSRFCFLPSVHQLFQKSTETFMPPGGFGGFGQEG